MDDNRDTAKEVRLMLEKALEDREVFIHINGEAEGVSLPAALTGSPNVTLKLSYYYRGPLVIGDDMVEADLLFPEGPFTCLVPIRHIWGITQASGESMFWPEHAPRQVLEEMIRGVATEKAPSEKTSGGKIDPVPNKKPDPNKKDEKKHQPSLQSVPKEHAKDRGEDEGAEVKNPEAKKQDQKASPKKKPPVLKRIK